MSDIDLVRAGLAEALGGLGYTPYPVLPGSPELPAAIVNSPARTEFHQTLEGHSKLTIPITLLVSRADEESAQKTLNAAISYKSGCLVQALEAAPKVAWLSLVVREAGPFVEVALDNNTKALGVDLTLELLA